MNTIYNQNLFLIQGGNYCLEPFHHTAFHADSCRPAIPPVYNYPENQDEESRTRLISQVRALRAKAEHLDAISLYIQKQANEIEKKVCECERPSKI